jgi:hypothetical protein
VSHDVDAKMRIGVWKQHGKQRFLFRMVNFGQQDVDTDLGKTCQNRGKRPPRGWGCRKQGLSEARAAGCHVAICSDGIFSKPEAGREGGMSDRILRPVALSLPR